ncbi:hypothetical protein KK062_10935 [Fulvivirgaceae bacterium PWU5]|uniref:DUF5675 domain-containing protein n=1 Tax=Dawidia cretensis TaxID=2782350 RepID=A0AAP2DWJ8_9BACT|nr:DUF5675 family protein [Dawidia cretensis]MBT1708743.1 hypothetical protein [Dawidia cretensis]
MELELFRKYYPDGTNGEIRFAGIMICYTIELPWLQNRRNVSCIPEGRYTLRKRLTAKRGLHLLVVDVPGRSCILIHPANHAKTELQGCIAPVLELTGPGSGRQSRLANERLKDLVLDAIDRGQEVYLTISKATTQRVTVL